jgi:uncharacterized protein YcaQ
MARADLATLRAYAVTRTLFPPTDLARAIDALGFVQIDPIRAPARAQDLVLRHRVAGYRIGDLERRFPELPLAEDFVHVYGVMPAATVGLLHPRSRDELWRVEREHPRLAQSILAHVERAGPTHPRDLRALGGTRMVNGWGGSSAATTRMLEALHYRGMLRVVRRDKGVKVYGPALPRGAMAPASTRARALLRMLVRLYAPLPTASLRPLAAMLAEESVPEDVRWRALDRLTKSDWLARSIFDGVEYVWPADESLQDEAPAEARLLAPFDPLVWDRRRFAHLWGWDYRFEGYTPRKKRRYGYYALPLLWRDRVVGWANVTYKGNRLAADVGFAGKPPRGRAFARALERELALLTESLDH